MNINGNNIEICTELHLPKSLVNEAAVSAIKENPENAPIIKAHSMFGRHIDSDTLTILTGRKWRRGRKLDISFIGGDDKIVKKVIFYARKWEKYANIRFNFKKSNGKIRIGFDRSKGSSSYIGTDALVIKKSKATMNFGWLYDDTPDEEYERVVLHEFGHALGCIHEHQHPEANIPWDRKAVYRYYKVVHGWSKIKVNTNIFGKYSRSRMNFTTYDKKSIMHYAIPNFLTIGDFEVPWNRTLSKRDKSFISRAY